MYYKSICQGEKVTTGGTLAMWRCKHMVLMVKEAKEVVNCTYHSTLDPSSLNKDCWDAQQEDITWFLWKPEKQPSAVIHTFFKTFHSPGPVVIQASYSFFTGNGAQLIILIHLSETIWVYRTGSSSQIVNMTHAYRKGRVEERHRATRLLWLEHWKHWNVPKGSRKKNVQWNPFYVCDSISMQMRNRNINMTAELSRGNWEN